MYAKASPPRMRYLQGKPEFAHVSGASRHLPAPDQHAITTALAVMLVALSMFAAAPAIVWAQSGNAASSTGTTDEWFTQSSDQYNPPEGGEQQTPHPTHQPGDSEHRHGDKVVSVFVEGVLTEFAKKSPTTTPSQPERNHHKGDEVLRDFVHQPQEDAEGYVVAKQLDAEIHQGYSELRPGLIYAQEPSAGTLLRNVRMLIVDVSMGPRPIQRMPDLVGHTLETAQIELAEANFPAPQLHHRFGVRPEGQVDAQQPPPGTVKEDGTQVVLEISDGPPLVLVPNVVGLSEQQAQTDITQSQPQSNYQGKEDSSKPNGTASRTNPPAGTHVDKNSIVAYWTASGGNAVPPLGNLTPDKLPQVLPDAGFQSGGITYRLTEGTGGAIVDQSPGAETHVPVGSKVAVTVSKQGIIVPSVVGSSADEAESILREKGLKVGSITRGLLTLESSEITEQKPAAGTLVEKDTAVALLISAPGIWTGGLLITGLLGAGTWGWHKHRIALSRKLLRLGKDFDPDGELRVTAGPPLDAPSIGINASIETDDAAFEGPVSIEAREVCHGREERLSIA